MLFAVSGLQLAFTVVASDDDAYPHALEGLKEFAQAPNVRTDSGPVAGQGIRDGRVSCPISRGTRSLRAIRTGCRLAEEASAT